MTTYQLENSAFPNVSEMFGDDFGLNGFGPFKFLHLIHGDGQAVCICCV